MSLTPTTPSFGQGVKAFWNRPEGTFGKVVLGIGAVGLVVAIAFFWGLIVPFLVAAAANTLELAGLIALLGVITSPIWSSTVRALTTNMFMSGCRYLTSIVIETDPIGMLRNNVEMLRKEAMKFGDAVTKLAGSKKALELDIDKKKLSIDQNMAKAQQAQAMLDRVQGQLNKAPNPNAAAELELQAQQLSLNVQGYKQTAGMAMQSNEQEGKLLDQTVKMYNNLRRIDTLCQFKIKFLSDQVDFYTAQRKTMLAGQAALGAANKIMKGNPAQQAIVEQTLEFLNDEAANTLGAIEDFNRWSQSYLTDMDVTNAAAAQLADKKFKEMEQKMVITQPSLAASNQQQFPTVFQIPTATPDKDGVYAVSDNDYTNMFQK